MCISSLLSNIIEFVFSWNFALGFGGTIGIASKRTFFPNGESSISRLSSLSFSVGVKSAPKYLDNLFLAYLDISGGS